MELSYAQKQRLFEQGFVQIPAAVPPIMVEAALRAINHSVGQGMNVEDMTTFRSQTYCPEITGTEVITDLLNRTPVWPLAESAIGAGTLRPVKGGQIALRFPGLQDPPALPRAHLDGMYSPHNGVPQGTIRNFTMLVGIFLSDIPQPYAGNFTVWPGTHHQYEAYFREHGPESLLEGMPPIEMPAPEQILAKAGDAVLCHYQLAHGAAPNVSPYVRYAIFFRLIREGHEEIKLECMTDIWREWDGLREFATRA